MLSEVIFNIESIFILFFIGTFFITYVIIPMIIGVAEYKNYTDKPNNRSSHKRSVPTLGGVAFFITLILSFLFMNDWNVSNISIFVIPGLAILFLTGLKDDLVVLSPASKLTAQLLAVVFVISNSAMQIQDFNGFLGIGRMPLLLIFPVTTLFMIVIINAYNLIDGIDGLASLIGIIISITFGIGFYLLGYYYFTILSIIIFAMLIAFLRYNLSYEKKIFMGDTGSLIIGFMISILTIRFLAIEPCKLEELPMYIENIPVVVMAILIVPVFDLGRVFLIRIMSKKNPFKPDRNHAHHILIDLGLSHPKASFILGLFNILFIILFIILGMYVSSITLLLIFIGLIFILLYAFYRLDSSFTNLKKRISNKRKVKDLKSKIFTNK